MNLLLLIASVVVASITAADASIAEASVLLPEIVKDSDEERSRLRKSSQRFKILASRMNSILNH